VDICLSVFWRLNLNNKVNVADVKSSCSNICGNEDLKFAFFESLHGDFSLVLVDISMHYLDVLLDLVSEDKVISVAFCLAEHNCFCTHSVAYQDIG